MQESYINKEAVEPENHVLAALDHVHALTAPRGYCVSGHLFLSPTGLRGSFQWRETQSNLVDRMPHHDSLNRGQFWDLKALNGDRSQSPSALSLCH